MNMIGYVEGCIGNSLVGWVIDRTACETQSSADSMVHVIDEHGRLVGSEIARVPRTDLAALKSGSTVLGFCVPVVFGRGKLLHVLVDKVELAGSPILIGATVFDGDVQIVADRAVGWVSRRCDMHSPVTIGLRLADGSEIGQAFAQPQRGQPVMRFDIPLDPLCAGLAEFVVTAQADGLFLSRASGRLAVRGALERVTAEGCSGWLWFPAVPGRIATVIATRDGGHIGRARCDQDRPDLAGRHAPSGRGFTLVFDHPHRSDELGVFHLRLEGSGRDLFDGPFLVGSRNGFMASGHRLARLGLLAEHLAPADRGVLQDILRREIGARRRGPNYAWLPVLTAGVTEPNRPITILVPLSRECGAVARVRDCLSAALACRRPGDHGLIVLDAPPAPEMLTMLAKFSRQDRVVVLRSEAPNSAASLLSRGLDACPYGDVLLLDAETLLPPDSLSVLHRVLHAAPDIASAGALMDAQAGHDWTALAELARAADPQTAVEAAPRHGCLLLRREVLNRIGAPDLTLPLDQAIVDLCGRATELGFRHVVAAGVLADPGSSLSRDIRHAGHRTIDRARMARHGPAGGRRLIVDGASVQPVAGPAELRLLVLDGGGIIQLDCTEPRLSARFADHEDAALIALLDAASVTQVLFRGLLGFGETIIRALSRWSASRDAEFVLRDFYAICPRATLVDAAGGYCGVAASAVCARCLRLGGAHPASRLGGLSPDGHRQLFAELVASMGRVVAATQDTARHLDRVFTGLRVTVPPRAEGVTRVRTRLRGQIFVVDAEDEAGGATLLPPLLAAARLRHPELRIIAPSPAGSDTNPQGEAATNIDAGYALFLGRWPDPTLDRWQKAMALGLLPIARDLGAVADAIRGSRVGVIYPANAEVDDILAAIETAMDVSRSGNDPV